MARGKPSFITKQIRGGRPVKSRPYKWGPGVPSLAIEFKEIPGESEGRAQTGVVEPVLGTQDLFAITTQDGFMIEIIP